MTDQPPTSPPPALCPPCAARAGHTAPQQTRYTRCPACGDQWRHGRWSRPAAWWARARDRVAVARSRRAALVAAQVAILDNQDQEEAAGIDWETDEYDRLHADYYARARRMPWWERVGVFDQAMYRVEHGRKAER